MSVYTEIPYVPTNTTDPAAGLNEALRVLRALTQTVVIDMDQTAPPGSPADGDMHIVAAGATGDWAGMDDYLAQWVENGAFWDFFAPGLARFVVNQDDGVGYFWNSASSPGAWTALT